MNRKMTIAFILIQTFIVFWNLENFYDYYDRNLNDSDKEFSSMGEKRWTKKKFYRKCEAISKSIFWIASQEGRLPAIFAFAEVENRYVLRQLLSSTLLGKAGYEIIHYDSPDPRGIDVGLVYLKDSITCVSSRPIRIRDLSTRDILLAQFITPEGDSLAVFVNHHPSKLGGKSSDVKRSTVVSQLAASADSLFSEGWTCQVAIGDFNDTPDNGIYDTLSPILYNISLGLHREGRGSIRFNGEWELIDQAWVSNPLAGYAEMKIFELPFLMEKDRANSGLKPLRTYSGPRYLGGVSDHCPIGLEILRYR